MKKFILFLFIAAFLSGCTVMDEIPARTNAYFIDFSKYSDKGFLFTPEGYLSDYSSVGIIEINMFPTAKNVGLDKITPHTRNVFNVQGGWIMERLSVSDIVDTVYSRCISMGADAVINFRIDVISENYAPPLVNGLRVTGFAIKRN